MKSHSDSVGAVAFSPDNNQALSGSADHTIKLWDLDSGQLIHTFEGHKKEVTTVAFAGDGIHFASISDDGTLKVWDIKARRELYSRKLVGNPGPLTFLRDSVHFLIGESARVTLRATDNGEVIKSFLASGVEAIGLSQDSNEFLTVNHTLEVQRWDIRNKSLKDTIPAQDPDDSGFFERNFNGHSIAISASHNLVTFGAYTNVGFWRFKPSHRMSGEGHSSYVKAVAFSPDGHLVASGSDDNTVKIWDPATGVLLHDLHGFNDQLLSVRISNDRRRALVENWNHAVAVWDLTSGRPIFSADGFFDSGVRPEGPFDALFPAQLLANGTRILMGQSTEDNSAGLNTLALWNVETKSIITTFEDFYTSTFFAVSTDGMQVVMSRAPGKYELWDMLEGTLLFSFDGAQVDPIVAFTPNKDQIIIKSADGTLKLRKLSKATEETLVKATNATTASVSFDGHVIFVGLADGTLLCLNLDNHTSRTVNIYSKPIRSIILSPRNDRMLTVADDGKVFLLDSKTGHSLTYFPPIPDSPITFSPTGDQFAIDDQNSGRISIFSAADGHLLRQLSGAWQSAFFSASTSIAFGAECDCLIYAGDDGTLKVDVQSPFGGSKSVSMIRGNKGSWLTISDDGTFAASNDGAIDSALVTVTLGRRFFSASQFFDELYHPDLIASLLQNDPLQIYHNHTAKLNLRELLSLGFPPTVERVGSPEIGADSVSVTVQISNAFGAGIGNKLIWRINNVAQLESKPAELRDYADKFGPVTITRGLKMDLGQDNVVSVTAYNAADMVASEPLVFSINKMGVTTELSKMYILAVAVDKYDLDLSGLTPLHFAVSDIRAMSDALKRAGEGAEGYKEVVILPPLTDEQVTKSNIESAFLNVRKEITPKDAFVLILAGHGLSVLGDGYYYLPYDFRIKDGVLKDGISADTWRNWIAENAEVTKRLLIIDTCESATATQIEARGISANRESAADRIREAVGHSVITSGREIAYEAGQFGHGLLSFAILKKLAETTSPANQITIADIAHYVEREVPALTSPLGITQKPFNALIGNFPIGISGRSSMPADLLACPASDQDAIFFVTKRFRKLRIARLAFDLKSEATW